MARRTAAANARLESILFASLAYLAKKRVRKEHKVAGTATPVVGKIVATIERSEITIDFDGKLIVGVKQEAAKAWSPTAAELAAWMLDQFEESHRDRILATLPVQFQKLGDLPQVPKIRTEQAEDLLNRLRGTKMAKKQGAVVFKLAGEDADDDEDDEE